MSINQQVGMGFIEILVGIALGLVVLAGTIYFIVNISTSSTKLLKTVRGEYQIQTALSLMANDIRRAGYWANASSMISTGANTNPFMVTGSTDLNTPTSNCILFAYDFNKDKLLPALGAANSDERFGYRLSNGAIQTRTGTDSTLSCTSGNWENLTDPSLLTITTLTFTLTTNAVPLKIPATSEALILRYVSISIAGHLKDDTSIVTALSTNIKVRNDKYQP